MGNLLSVSLDDTLNQLCQCLGGRVAFLHDLEINLTSLENAMADLKAKQTDLLRKLQREEDRGLKRLDRVQVWISSVDSLQTQVNNLLTVKDAHLQSLCVCGYCSKSLRSTYSYGKHVSLTLTEVEKLKIVEFEVISEQPPTPIVEEIQLQETTIVGQQTLLDKSWEHLMKDEVGVVGMFGMGGVGKTTLLTQLYNKFSQNNCGFDYLIWIVVSQELNVDRIRDEIKRKVGLSGEENIGLFSFLRKKRFIVFLDDMWEKIELSDIGVPDPRTQQGSKLVFTTRSRSVCYHMGVEDPIEVPCLADAEAFDLFQKKVGQVTLGSNPEIPALAKEVAQKCYGLPLALNVIGQTMSCKKTPQEWRHAVDVLSSYATEFSGMKDKILPLLKYSYDNLEAENVKSAFLYCSLLGEDAAEINTKELIEYWIGEGIIDGSKSSEKNSIEKAENEGYDIIGTLVRSSLLTEVDGDCVKMHDVVREMALWIASDLGKQKDAFIVHENRFKDFPKVQNWAVVRRMSLRLNQFSHLDGSPECPVLTTLLLRSNFLVEYISSEFFKSMPRLAVLDLNCSPLLTELPEGISELVSLQYLNLGDTRIRRLPKGLHELRKLIHLNLCRTRSLESIEGISNVQNLKVLKLENSGFEWDSNTVKELEALEHLEVLTVTIKMRTGTPPLLLQSYLSSPRLMKCTRILGGGPLESSGISLPIIMEKCIFLSLVKVNLCHFKGLRELTFLVFAHNLECLYVSVSDDLEEIISKEKACEFHNSGILPFLKLKELELFRLTSLKTIFWSPLPFPCLENIKVRECPNLKKLPLDSKSGADSGLIIDYRQKREWLEALEWEDEATKNRFLSQKLPLDYDSIIRADTGLTIDYRQTREWLTEHWEWEDEALKNRFLSLQPISDDDSD